MSTSTSPEERTATTICIIAVCLIFIINPLIRLFEIIIPLVYFGAIVYVVIKLIGYNKRTGDISRVFQNLIHKERKDTIELPYQEKELPQTSRQNVEIELELIQDKIKNLEEENKKLKLKQKKKIKKKVKQQEKKIIKQAQESLLHEFMPQYHSTGYNKSSAYENEKFERQLRRREEEVSRKDFENRINQKMNLQDNKLNEWQYSNETRFSTVTNEMRSGFFNVYTKLLSLEEKVNTIKQYFDEKIIVMEQNLKNSIQSVSEYITNVRYELKTEFSDIKLNFGKEVLRLDKQQLVIVDKLRQYKNDVDKFGSKLEQVRLEAHQDRWQGRKMLERTQMEYEKHQLKTKALKDEIGIYLNKIDFKGSEFDIKVGQAKLMLEEASVDQYHALKQIGYEKIGINILRSDHEKSYRMEMDKLNRERDNIKFLEQKIHLEQANNRDVTELQHRLNLVEQNKVNLENKVELIRRENSLITRYSK